LLASGVVMILAVFVARSIFIFAVIPTMINLSFSIFRILKMAIDEVNTKGFLMATGVEKSS
jgi:hypothetical protein